jgi:hypothetical protein
MSNNLNTSWDPINFLLFPFLPLSNIGIRVILKKEISLIIGNNIYEKYELICYIYILTLQIAMHVCDFYFASCFQISFAVQSWAAMLPCQ